MKEKREDDEEQAREYLEKSTTAKHGRAIYLEIYGEQP